jgi:Flp pilus assembly protein TadB
MQQNSHYPVAETLWVLVGIILLLAYGDALVLVGFALAMMAVTAAWWMRRGVKHRAKRSAQLAPVTRLRPAPTHAPWRGHSAA